MLAKAQAMLEALQQDYDKLVEDCALTDVVLLVCWCGRQWMGSVSPHTGVCLR
jgi:hypothetical protein